MKKYTATVNLPQQVCELFKSIKTLSHINYEDKVAITREMVDLQGQKIEVFISGFRFRRNTFYGENCRWDEYWLTDIKPVEEEPKPETIIDSRGIQQGVSDFQKVAEPPHQLTEAELKVGMRILYRWMKKMAFQEGTVAGCKNGLVKIDFCYPLRHSEWFCLDELEIYAMPEEKEEAK